MPLLVKDIEDVEGWPTTFGSLVFRQAPPAARDSPVVARLRAAGAVVVGRSNTCEFAFEGYTSNRLHGSTLNPWRTDWSAGGSSGGSAAALAAGMVPIATSSDGGGSVRIPASLCGLLGLRPSRGVVDGARQPSWIDFHSDAILAQSASDLALLTTLLTGPPLLGGQRLEPPSTIRRVVLVPRLTGEPSALDTRRTAHHRELLEEAFGPVVEETTVARLFGDEPDLPGRWEDDWYSASSAEQAHLLGSEVVERWSDAWDPQFLEALRHGLDVTTHEYLSIRRRCAAAQRLLDELLVPGTLLAAPVLTGPGYSPDGRAPGLATPGSPPGLTQTVLANLTGHPAISLPTGLDELGLPQGLQVLSGRQQDLTLVGLARRWEEVHPWPSTAPGFTPFDDAWGASS